MDNRDRHQARCEGCLKIKKLGRVAGICELGLCPIGKPSFQSGCFFSCRLRRISAPLLSILKSALFLWLLLCFEGLPALARQQRDGHSARSTQRGRLSSLARAGAISLDLHEANMGDVLRLLAKQNALNIIASDSVKGTITLTLQNVSVEEALEGILRAKGYRYLIDGDIIVVKQEKEFGITDMETRVYRLHHVDANNVLEAIAEIKSPAAKVKVLTPGFNNRADVYEINKRRSFREEQFWQRSSVLLVTDLPSHLDAIDKVIAALDVAVPQIMIAARLIELAPQEKNGLGIEWDRELKTEFFDIDQSKSPTYDYSAQTRRGMSFNLATLNARQFKIVLKYLQEHTNSRLLSNPRILTMDNEPSDISVGTTFPIPFITRGSIGQGDIVTFTYKDVNITLRVTPHVTEDSTVTMHVNPIIEEVTGEVVIDQNSAPITAKRKVDTVVKVRSGHTVVIGGLIREKEVETLKKVWLFGDLPLLGHLFRSKDKEKMQTDLVIFLTPQIVGK